MITRAPLPVPPLLLIVAGALYLGTPLELLLGFPLHPARSYMSELAAADQPLGALFRFTDGTAGVLVVLAVGMIWRRPGLGRLRGWSLAALGVFGAATVADVIFPMACASSASASCARADAAGTLGIGHDLHTAASVIALAAVVVSATLFAMHRNIRARTGSAQGGLVMVQVLVALLVLTSAAMSVVALGAQLPDGAGYLQRGQTALISLYLICLAVLGSREEVTR